MLAVTRLGELGSLGPGEALGTLAPPPARGGVVAIGSKSLE